MSSEGVLIFGKKIGGGVFGDIVNATFYKKRLVLDDYRGEALESSTKYAIKVPKGEDLQLEMDNLKLLGTSPYIIKVYGTATIPSPNQQGRMVLVMELLSTTLGQKLKKPISIRRYAFPKLLKNAFEAVAFLDSKKFVHRDLHYNNVMFGNSDVPKLIDFGLAKQVEDQFVPFPALNDNWRVFHPPEQRMMLNGRYRYGMCTRKFDVYSMAMNMIEFVHDQAKNLIPGLFHMLIRQTILRSSSDNFNFSYLDTQNKYPTPTSLNECIIVEASSPSDIHTYFRQGFGGLPNLVLHMPVRLGSILKRCLMFDRNRPSARDVLTAIREYDNRTRQSSQPSAQRFLDPRVSGQGRGLSRGRGRGLPRGRGRGLSRGRGRGLSRGRGRGRDMDVTGKRKRLRF